MFTVDNINKLVFSRS